MTRSSLAHLIYASTAVRPFSSAALRELVTRARVKNDRIGVSGMLLHTAGSFFQVLEGSESVIRLLFDEVASDPRHKDVLVIIKEPIAKRAFGDWTMGLVTADPSELAGIEDLDGLFADDASLSALSPGRAKKLLNAFASGRWRTKANPVQ